MKFLLDELVCCECKDTFQTASSLLKHFASHAIRISSNTCLEIYGEVSNCKTRHRSGNRKMIPGLHPIVKNIHKESQNLVINPLIFCETTLDEDDDNCRNKQLKRNNSSKTKKYKCMYCQKQFGWSTDLKRHTLIHTGERPFKCNQCSLSFTRNFLLQKHISKSHKFKKGKIPDLKPIYLVPNEKIKKQPQNPPITKIRETNNVFNKFCFEMVGNTIYSNKNS